MPSDVRQNLPPELPVTGMAQRRASVVEAILSPESDAGQGEEDPDAALALAFSRHADRRMSGGRRIDGRGRVSFTAARPQRASVHGGESQGKQEWT